VAHNFDCAAVAPGSTGLRNPHGTFAANQFRQHVNGELFVAVFLAFRHGHAPVD
jgi:hypothetical protein